MEKAENAETRTVLNQKEHQDNPVYYIPAIIAIAFVHFALQPIDGYIGSDYYHYEARTLFGLVHFYQNFLKIPHYNPYLCGGLPFFADPQCYYYSLHQVFTLFIDPFQAFLLSLVVMNIIAYFSTIALLKRFKIDIRIAHICSLAFVLNGFSFANFFAGHVTHHSFLLIPLILFLLFYGSSHVVKGSIFLALVTAYMYYSGGLHVMVVLFMTGILLLPYLLRVNLRNRTVPQFFIFAGLAALFLIATCSGKFAAGVLYSKTFISRGVDFPTENFIVFITRYFWFLPAVVPDKIIAGGAIYEPWEYIGFISKIAIPGLVGILVMMFMKLDRKRIIFYSINIVVIAFVLTIGYGMPFNAILPFFKGYHNAMKLLGAFIPFILLVTAFGLNFLLKNKFTFMNNKVISLSVFFILSALMLVEYRAYTGYFTEKRFGVYHPYNNDTYNRIKADKKAVPVERIIDKWGEDKNAFETGASSLDSYEANFGYAREKMMAVKTLIPGSVYTIESGYYNMTHPGALVYPEYFGLEPWSRIPVGYKEQMDKFVNSISPNFGVPLWQTIIIYINVVTLLSLCICSIYFIAEPTVKKIAEYLHQQKKEGNG